MILNLMHCTKILILLLMLSPLPNLAQDQSIFPFSFERSEIIDPNKIYDKKSEEKIPVKDAMELLKNNPEHHYEAEINRYGEVGKFWYDPNNKSKSTNPKPFILESGQSFPLFTFKTLNGKELTSESLIGNIVIIGFEVAPTTFRLQKDHYNQLVSIIKSKEQTCSITLILIFMYDVNPDDLEIDLDNTVFNFVENGMNFRQRYRIVNFPSTLLIDESGRFVEKYEMGSEINLHQIYCNLK
jgi:hypothetical protein